MASAEGFEERLDLVVDYVERIGDEVINEIEGRTGDGKPVKGFQCKHGDHAYQVLTTPDWEQLNVRFQFSADAIWLIHNSSEYNLDQIDEEDTHGIALSPNEMGKPRRELENELQSYPDVEKREMRLNLKQILSREGCSVEFDTITNSFNIHGFTVSKNLYPERGEFLIGQFEHSVQNVVNFGWTARDIILEYYGLTTGTSPGSPGFQN